MQDGLFNMPGGFAQPDSVRFGFAQQFIYHTEPMYIAGSPREGDIKAQGRNKALQRR